MTVADCARCARQIGASARDNGRAPRDNGAVREPCDGDYRTLAGFRAELRRFLRFSEQAAAAAGLTPRQYQALLALRGSAGRRLTVGALAAELELRHHSAVELVDRLCALGLVRRHVDPADRRRVEVSTTARGAAALRRLANAHRAELRAMAPTLRALLRTVSSSPRAGRE
jgi:DNA-binding MarR family transcriptional regulator